MAKRPVPLYTCQRITSPDTKKVNMKRTDRTTDSNHLQMATLQMPGQGRIGGASIRMLDIEDFTIRTDGPGRCRVRIGIALEAVENSRRE